MPDATNLTQLHLVCRSFFRGLLMTKIHWIDVLFRHHVFFVLPVRLSASIQPILIFLLAIISGPGSLLFL